MSTDRDRALRIGVVSAGRLGGSLATALRNAGRPVVAVSRPDHAAARELAGRLASDAVPDPLGTDDAQAVVDAADLVFLTPPDDAVGSLAARLTFRDGQRVVHCSGALPVSTLKRAADDGAAIGGFHPLQAFPDDRGDDRFSGVTFGIEAEDPDLTALLERLSDELGGRSIRLDPASRPLYHASAVLAGPMTAALAALAADLWSAFGADRDAGLRALAPLLQSTADRVPALGVPAALTGPFVRGDVGPVRTHLDALAESHPDLARAYAALALAQLPLATERSDIPHDRIRELRELLRGAMRDVEGG